MAKQKKQKRTSFFRRHKILAGLLLLILLWQGCSIWEAQQQKAFFARLNKRITKGDKVIPIAEVAPFEWDYVCSIYVYEHPKLLKLIAGGYNLSWFAGEDGEALIFIKNNRIITEFVWNQVMDPAFEGRHFMTFEGFGKGSDCGIRETATISTIDDWKKYIDIRNR